MSSTTMSAERFASGLMAAVVAAAVLLVGADAEAGEYDDTWGMFEVKLGPYHPMVDRDFDNGPYEAFFDDRSMLYGEAALDVHLWRQFGTLSLGMHAGYGKVSAPMVDDEGREVDAGDLSALRNIPLRGSLVYRYDYSAHHHGIPLVPVAKAGLNYNFWRVTDPAGDTMAVDDHRGAGGTAGVHATLGLHLHLDFFDPTSAASMGLIWGVDNSFLFAEYTISRVGVFRDDAIDLSANHWAAGLAFEF